MAFAKFQENQFRIDKEIAENHVILVNLTASIMMIYDHALTAGYAQPQALRIVKIYNAQPVSSLK